MPHDLTLVTWPIYSRCMHLHENVILTARPISYIGWPHSLTHNAHKYVAEDERSENDPEKDITEAELRVGDLTHVVVNFSPVVQGEQLEESDQGIYDGAERNNRITSFQKIGPKTCFFFSISLDFSPEAVVVVEIFISFRVAVKEDDPHDGKDVGEYKQQHCYKHHGLKAEARKENGGSKHLHFLTSNSISACFKTERMW